MRNLKDQLLSEKKDGYNNGIYHKMKVSFTFHSDWIEGIRLTKEQVLYLLDLQRISAENIRVNDIIETVNHFRCFDYILDTLSEPITEEYILNLHRILKSGIMESRDTVIGAYKKYPNAVGETVTVMPEEVPEQIRNLLHRYSKPEMTLQDIAVFHAEYEKIHPFYDGNGRTGRLLMLKQCLENDIVPFLIGDSNKMLYYNGLRIYQQEQDSEPLVSSLVQSQNEVKQYLDYFRTKS
ncbi:MAG: Fic family protein [Oscillospiraceae bacterium]|nr:Fic family protein [Oscillospiraceae bacterium]